MKFNASDRHFLRSLARSPAGAATRTIRSPSLIDLALSSARDSQEICRKVRVDVRFCGLTGSDVLLWRGEHRRIPKSTMVLGFEVSGTILEMGRLAHERTGYQMGEEVVVHNYPVCGGLAESCLAHYSVGRFTLKRRVVSICMLQIPLGDMLRDRVICKISTPVCARRLSSRAPHSAGVGPAERIIESGKC